MSATMPTSRRRQSDESRRSRIAAGRTWWGAVVLLNISVSNNAEFGPRCALKAALECPQMRRVRGRYFMSMLGNRGDWAYLAG
jgi:hypothetical protein